MGLFLAARTGWILDNETTRVILHVIEILEDLGLDYHVGGSFASSVHGVPRQTRDLDLVVDLPLSRVPAFTSHFEKEFYLDADSIRRALQRRGSFNLIHLESAFKIDIFPPGPSVFDRIEMERSAPHAFLGDPPRDILVASAEDTLLRKLQWYRLGGEVSDRQWGDVAGIVKTQGDRLDLVYLRRWAEKLEVEDLLERALEV